MEHGRLTAIKRSKKMRKFRIYRSSNNTDILYWEFHIITRKRMEDTRMLALSTQKALPSGEYIISTHELLEHEGEGEGTADELKDYMISMYRREAPTVLEAAHTAIVRRKSFDYDYRIRYEETKYRQSEENVWSREIDNEEASTNNQKQESEDEISIVKKILKWGRDRILAKRTELTGRADWFRTRINMWMGWGRPWYIRYGIGATKWICNTIIEICRRVGIMDKEREWAEGEDRFWEHVPTEWPGERDRIWVRSGRTGDKITNEAYLTPLGRIAEKQRKAKEKEEIEEWTQNIQRAIGGIAIIGTIIGATYAYIGEKSIPWGPVIKFVVGAFFIIFILKRKHTKLAHGIRKLVSYYFRNKEREGHEQLKFVIGVIMLWATAAIIANAGMYITK